MCYYSIIDSIILFYSADLLAPPFNFTQSELRSLRTSLIDARDHLPILTAKDGGRKVKISSDDPNVFSSLDSYLKLKPLLRILYFFTTPEFLSFAYRYLLFQHTISSHLDLAGVERINLITPPHNFLPKCDTRFAWSSNYPIARKLMSPWLSRAIVGTWRDSPPSNFLNLIPRFHVSFLDPASFIRPHLDSASKVLSLMLYLPTPVQEMHMQLGTAFHTPSLHRHTSSIATDKHNRISDFVSFSDSHNTIYSSFSSGRLIFFAPSHKSWHSFEYPKNLNVGTRLSININYHLLGFD